MADERERRREKLLGLIEEMRAAVATTDYAYEPPSTPPTEIGMGLAFVVWSRHFAFPQTRWVSLNLRGDEVVIKRHETQGPRVVCVDIKPLSDHPRQLREAWLWLEGFEVPRGVRRTSATE